MNLQLDPLVEETIAVCLSHYGIDDEVISEAIDNIHLCLKETNSLHNSVADSNYYAAEIRKEDRRIVELSDENKKLELAFEKERESYLYEIRQLRYKLEDMKDEQRS
jgi:hypothetical protein